MLILILISTLISNAMASAELRSLYGVRDGNRVTLCMSAGVAGRGRDVCAGALWRRHWVLVHASCVAHRALYPVVLVRDHADDVDCEEVQQGSDSGQRACPLFYLSHRHEEGGGRRKYIYLFISSQWLEIYNFNLNLFEKKSTTHIVFFNIISWCIVSMSISLQICCTTITEKCSRDSYTPTTPRWTLPSFVSWTHLMHCKSPPMSAWLCLLSIYLFFCIIYNLNETFYVTVILK